MLILCLTSGVTNSALSMQSMVSVSVSEKLHDQFVVRPVFPGQYNPSVFENSLQMLFRV